MDTKALYYAAKDLAMALKVYVDAEAARQHKTADELAELHLQPLGWTALKRWEELTERYK